MKIVLVGNYRGDRQESMLRFSTLLQEGLKQAGHDVKVVRPAEIVSRLRPGTHGVGKWLGYVDKFVLFPGMLRAAVGWADVVHICDHSNAMYSSCVGGKPCVVTCHDMLAVRGALGEETDCKASLTGRYLQRWIVRGLRRSSVLVSVSTATGADVERIVGGGVRHRGIILNALNHPYRRISQEEALGRLRQATELDSATPFVLHVGQNHARKNRAGVIRAFAQASREVDCRLVLAGQALNRELQELIAREGVADRVTVMVEPSNEVLEALYNRALALLFPSRYEGFGWPLIESQACGCPVICSRCAPFAEVVGSSAIVRDVDDERGFAEAIVRLARDAGEREAWSAKGLRNAARFEPEQMIARYLDVYGELAKQPSGLVASVRKPHAD
jgi:glycosyltransferase involved in cell wall biosynthesis